MLTEKPETFIQRYSPYEKVNAMDDGQLHRVLAEGKHLRLVARDGWEWVERRNAENIVVIVPVTSDRRLVLIEQYRVPVGAPVIELPAGLVGDRPGAEQEKLLEAARRELLEETGYVSDRWHYLLEGPSSTGLTSEGYTLFLAAEARRVGDGGGDESEEIHVHAQPLEQIESWLGDRRREGKPVDPKVQLGIFFARDYCRAAENSIWRR